MSLTKSNGEQEIKHTQTYSHTTQNRMLVSGGLHILGGKRECLPELECLYFIRSVQVKYSAKNQVLTIFDA
jgi:hypothetical protein